ncbi:MAG: histidine triad nucleotide-binding protein [Gammaproteobacteria bacterium GWE2_37_16]|nr:MAG: histidine triad nucleotide-binding protein [Gammaproteobacteria bacterium GWE2_37_16]
MSCIFCKIANGEISAKIIYQDERVVAFNDLSPQAPQHYLIIPRKHLATLNDLTNEDVELAGHMLCVAKQIAIDLGIAETGYRTVINCNSDGGQAVYHLHLHLLGGRQMEWPPG